MNLKSNHASIFYLTCLFLVLSTAAIAAPPAAAPPAVVVQTIQEKEVNPYQEFVGRIEAIQSVDIQARVEGYLDKVAFQEGSMVSQGQLLYKIEPDTYQALVNVNKAKVAKAEAALKKAQQYYDRVKNVKTGGISATDRDTAKSDLLQAKADLQEAKANLSQTELDLGYTTIKAPISGRIGKTSYTKGNLVSSSSGALARIVQINPIRVVFSISENLLSEAQLVRKDSSKSTDIKLRLPDEKIYPFAGSLQFLDNVVDTTTGTIAIWAQFPNPEATLVPGQYVTVLVGSKKSKKMPIVPQVAVLEDKEGKYVFVVDGTKKAQPKRIKIGPALGTGWAVESGLMPGENVIVSGIQKVRPGMQVNPSIAGK